MRLAKATAARLPDAVERGAYDRRAQRRGIVHLGIGAFHRAHQAVYTDAAMASGDRDWAITGVSLRSPDVRDRLTPQDGLYTVTERGPAGDRTRLVGSVAEVLVGGGDDAAIRAALAAPETRLVTLTVTEKGYCLRPDGTLDADLAGGANTIYPHLARAIADRHAAWRPPLSLVSCDNLPANGAVLRRALIAFLDRHAPAARGWFEDAWSCPSTMVDRIVPATTPDDLDTVEAAIGLRDEAAVVTEPYAQWVIEDRFVGPRPRWEAFGAQIVADVRPFEIAKLRMLNGAHSALAYLGLAKGHRFVHEAVADPAIRPIVETLMRREAATTIPPSASLDPERYADTLLARFANDRLPHRLAQIATDGSQKIGPRWLDVLVDAQLQDGPKAATLTALAAWVAFTREPRGVADPQGEALRRIWRQAGEDAIVEALFGERGVFAPRWVLASGDRERLRALLVSSSNDLGVAG